MSVERHNILVVEDDYMIAQDVALEVERAGGAVIEPVPSGDDALRLIDAGGCDAAILDVNLGEEDSFPIAQALQVRSIPFVFATGYNSADVPPEWKHVTAIMKPLRVATVVGLLVGRLTTD